MSSIRPVPMLSSQYLNRLRSFIIVKELILRITICRPSSTKFSIKLCNRVSGIVLTHYHLFEMRDIGEPYRFTKRTSVVLRCRACHTNVSLTATTVMKFSHTPLSVWFWGAYLVTTQTPGQSALQFQRQLGLSRYETAFQILHKLRAGLVRPERDAIGNQYPVEVDETLVGGRTKGEGRGVHHKVTVVEAVEIRTRPPEDEGKKHKRTAYAGRLRLRLVPGRGAKELTEFVQENVVIGAVVRTDGWKGYDELTTLGYLHKPLVLEGDPEKTDAHLPMIHIAFSNLKTWLLGTHHGVS